MEPRAAPPRSAVRTGRRRRAGRARAAQVLAALAVPALLACSADDPVTTGGKTRDELVCDLDLRYLVDGGVGRDGIPALSNPRFLPAEPRVDEISYFLPTDRIIAYWSAGDWLVIPHNIMWRHEIVNLPEATITYCPLTGSAMAFARLSVDGAEMGVSGLLYQANLIMYDRNEPDESFWPQMLGEARCGPRSGQTLIRVPVMEMTWEGWIELHPESKVLALTPDMYPPTLYFRNPYGSGYEELHNEAYGFPIPLDARRPPKERVLGIPDGEGGGVAFPFLAMAEVGDLAAIEHEHEGEGAVILWDGRRRAAMAYRASVDSEPATFAVSNEGFVDSVTGTTWAVDGTPVEGAFAGTSRRLRPVVEAYVAFWGAWAAFHPGTRLWEGG